MNPIHSFFASDLGKALLPPLGAVVVATIGAAINWAKDLSGTSLRTRRVEEATKRVQFWDLWLKTVSALEGGSETGKAAALRELQLAAVGIRESFARSLHARHYSVAEFRAYKAGLGFVQRFSMLYQQPSSSAAGFRKFAYLMVPVFMAEAAILAYVVRPSVVEGAPELAGYVLPAFSLIGLGVSCWVFSQSKGFFEKRENEYLIALAAREESSSAANSRVTSQGIPV